MGTLHVRRLIADGPTGLGLSVLTPASAPTYAHVRIRQPPTSMPVRACTPCTPARVSDVSTSVASCSAEGSSVAICGRCMAM
jgi:hypothetical protein